MSFANIIATNLSGQEHLSKVAWIASRSKENNESLDEILKVDAPVNEISNVTLHVRCTILEREIFTTARDHVLWARTSRVDDPADAELDSSLKEHLSPEKFRYIERAFYKNRAYMRDCKERGVRQDTYRIRLPLSSYTEFTTTISLRSLVKLMITIGELITEHPHLSPLTSLYSSLLSALSQVCRSEDTARALLATYKSPHLVHESPVPTTSARVGDIVVVHTSVPLMLRAQVIRHRTLHVVDTLGELLADPHVWESTIATTMRMTVSAPASIWKAICGKRLCWIAQYDLWAPLITEASKFVTDEQSLPCANGICPYSKDDDLRYTDADPNPPCPRRAVLEEKIVPAKFHDLIVQEATARGPYWTQYSNLGNVTAI